MRLLNGSKWNRVRAQGLLRFILVWGILRFGVAVSLSTFLVLWIGARFVPGGSEWDADAWRRLVLLLLTEAVVGGAIWAVGTWYLSEWLFRRSRRAPQINAGA
jgi:hypothetical protein